jgi:PAS domain S-box-containing protein
MKIEKSLRLLCEIENAISGFILKLNQNNSTVEYSCKLFDGAESEYKNFISSLNKISKNTYKNIRSSSQLNEFKAALGKSYNLYSEKLISDEYADYILIRIKKKNKNVDPDEDKLALVKEIIVDQIRTEIDLHERYEETTSNINVVIYSASPDGTRLHFVSENVDKLFGIKPKDIIKNKYSLLRRIKPSHFPQYNIFIKDLKAGVESVCDYQIMENDKNKRWIRHYGKPVFENKKVKSIVGIIEDVTDEKKMLSLLRKSEEKFRLLADTAGDLVITLNSFGYVSLINRSGANSLGYTPDELLGKHFLEFVNEDTKSELADAFQDILRGKRESGFNAVLIDKLKKEMAFEFQASPIRDDNVVSGMLVVGSDVTRFRKDDEKMKELNIKLSEANRLISIERDRAKQQLTVLEEINKLKNDFVSRVSHEFRTPLASIVGFAETIVSDEDLPDEMVSEFSKIILTEGKRLARLVNDVLDFSKFEEERTEIAFFDCNMIELINNVIDRFERQAGEKSIQLSKEIPQAEIIISANHDIIRKAISCLIDNAIKFNSENGRVTVIVQDFLKEVEIIINDTGIGIPEENLHMLFQKFTTLERSGSQDSGAGLGLAYVHKAVTLHRGLIQVKSEINKGTTFLIKLPKKTH